MLSKILLGVTLSVCATGAYADAGCDSALMARYQQAAPIVDSMRPDKGAQMRVFASDGSVFNAGQALWMQGQLRRFERLCVRTTNVDGTEAARVLAGVEELLEAHRPSR